MGGPSGKQLFRKGPEGKGEQAGGAASQEGHQQSKGSDSCPPFSTDEVPCEVLSSFLGEMLPWVEGWGVGLL